MLDSYTCTECGRCTAACPANLTGKVLSPKQVIVDIRHLMDEQAPPSLPSHRKKRRGRDRTSRTTSSSASASSRSGTA